MTPSPLEQQGRNGVKRQIVPIVEKILPDCSLELFGSERTQLAAPTSDIDFRISHRDLESEQGERGPSLTRPANQKIMRNRLFKVMRYLNGHHSFVDTKIRYGRYPLLSVVHARSRLEVQIVSNNDTVSAREYMRSYLAEYPTLRDLYFVIRTALHERVLTDVYRGGLGSYCIFMMLVASLKLHPIERADDIGRQFLNFLSLYSDLDTYKFGISVEPPGYITKRPATQTPSLLERQEFEENPVISFLLQCEWI
jgi:non-canonical poly(A) RNA polymerase PAPD5/7